jgi:hypothetical protein
MVDFLKQKVTNPKADIGNICQNKVTKVTQISMLCLIPIFIIQIIELQAKIHLYMKLSLY